VTSDPTIICGRSRAAAGAPHSTEATVVGWHSEAADGRGLPSPTTAAKAPKPCQASCCHAKDARGCFDILPACPQHTDCCPSNSRSAATPGGRPHLTQARVRPTGGLEKGELMGVDKHMVVSPPWTARTTKTSRRRHANAEGSPRAFACNSHSSRHAASARAS
jgi:hypothetical protein